MAAKFVTPALTAKAQRFRDRKMAKEKRRFLAGKNVKDPWTLNFVHSEALVAVLYPEGV